MIQHLRLSTPWLLLLLRLWRYRCRARTGPVSHQASATANDMLLIFSLLVPYRVLSTSGERQSSCITRHLISVLTLGVARTRRSCLHSRLHLARLTTHLALTVFQQLTAAMLTATRLGA